MIKPICVAYFSSHYFKKVSSLSTHIEEQLNKDTRLDVNTPQDQHLNLKNVLLEIQRIRTKINQHQDDGEDSLKAKSSDDFSLLRLTTNWSYKLMLLKQNRSPLNQDSKVQWTSQSKTPKNSPDF